MRLRTGGAAQICQRAILVAAIGVFLVAASSACRASWQDEPPCFPPDYAVSPSSAKPGDIVAVGADDALCNPRYGQDALIQVTVTDAAGQNVIKETAPMNDAGGFSFRFVLPQQTSAGEASVEAVPYALDWCDDTGRNNRVAHPSGLQRASCAARTEPLTVTL
ncbi:hypothetical protein QF038_002275 [Pseudarthrobacter sp. W1I19]|nr:hypothetical protein [Pseudarthrobacter sp. W1I19]